MTQRCRIILAAAAGRQDKQIAEDLQINFKSAALWRARFLKKGTDCLWEVAAGRGRKATYPLDKVAAIIKATLVVRISKANKSVRAKADRFKWRGFGGGGRGVGGLWVRGRGC